MTRADAVRFLQEGDNFLILTHKRPDGDTVGCAAALCLALRDLGKTAWVLENPDTTALFLPYLEGLIAPSDFRPERVVSVDVATLNLLPDNAAPYQTRIDLAIDHHPSNTGFARLNYVEADKAACGEILYDLIGDLTPITSAIALPLYVAITTDTGCFVYSNTTAHTHRVAAALMDIGFASQSVHKRHFRTKSLKRLRIEAELLQNMHLYEDGTVAVVSITLALLDKFQADNNDLEDIAAFIGQVEGVRHAITIRELAPGESKISLRTAADLNASSICAKLGGGGHAAAAGCTVSLPPAEAETAIMDALRQVKDAQ